MKTSKLIRAPIRRSVISPRNSTCCSANLADLDWSNWFMDGGNLQAYLHVRRLHPHLDSEDPRDATWHRVFCRSSECPRLTMKNGKLFWLI